MVKNLKIKKKIKNMSLIKKGIAIGSIAIVISTAVVSVNSIKKQALEEVKSSQEESTKRKNELQKLYDLYCLQDKTKDFYTVEDYKNNGITMEELVKDGDTTIYKIIEIDTKKCDVDILSTITDLLGFVPKTKNVKISHNFNNIKSDAKLEDVIANIKTFNIDSRNKKIIEEIIYGYGKSNINTNNLYNNLINIQLIENENISASYYEPGENVIVMQPYEYYEKELESAKILLEMGILDNDTYNAMKSEYKYVMCHEMAHACTLKNSDEEFINVEDIIAIVDSNNQITQVSMLGNFIDEGKADYITNEVTGLKPNLIYAYPENLMSIIAIKNMLNIDIESLDVDSILKKGVELGFSKKDMLYYITDFDSALCEHKYMTSTQKFYDSTYFENVFNLLIDNYIRVRQDQGISNDEIQIVLNQILDEICEKIQISNKNGEEIIESGIGAIHVSLDHLKECIDNLTNNKTYSLKFKG